MAALAVHHSASTTQGRGVLEDVVTGQADSPKEARRAASSRTRPSRPQASTVAKPPRVSPPTREPVVVPEPELLRASFEDLGLRRVTVNCFADNTASWRLMERVAMRRELNVVAESATRIPDGNPADG